MTPEERAEYLRQWRKRHPSHYKRGVETYVCPVCGRTDTADGSERAQSGLCLDCWCARENRKTDARLRERIEDLRNRREERGAGLREFHEAGEIVVLPTRDEEKRRKVREYQRRYYAEHSEKVREWHRAYYEAHRKSLGEYKRRWRKRNIEDVREYKRKYYAEHRDEMNERARRYRETHREEIRKQQMDYYHAHREQRIASALDYQRRNSEKIREYKRRKYLEKKQKGEQG